MKVRNWRQRAGQGCWCVLRYQYTSAARSPGCRQNLLASLHHNTIIRQQRVSYQRASHPRRLIRFVQTREKTADKNRGHHYIARLQQQGFTEGLNTFCVKLASKPSFWYLWQSVCSSGPCRSWRETKETVSRTNPSLIHFISRLSLYWEQRLLF